MKAQLLPGLEPTATAKPPPTVAAAQAAPSKAFRKPSPTGNDRTGADRPRAFAVAHLRLCLAGRTVRRQIHRS
jgi:hypothetical protein